MAEKDRSGKNAVGADKKNKIGRRTFLKYSAALGAAASVSGIRFQTANGVDLSRKVAAGNTRVLGCNPMTSTDGYWDHSTPPALRMKSGRSWKSKPEHT